MIGEHAGSFAGKPVKDYQPGQVTDPAGTIYRVGFGYEACDAENSLTTLLDQFLAEPGVEQTTGIIIGAWKEMGAGGEECADIISALVAAKDRLPRLEAVFIADVVSEECEISWINQADYSSLLQAFPQLKHLRVRGSQGLGLGRLGHQNLQTLILESGGLPQTVVHQVAEANLPNLEWLELWLGVDSYGGDATVDDLSPFFVSGRFPKLKRLGLRDSDMADEIAEALLGASVLDQIGALDLSLSTLSDKGGAALLDNPAVAKLKTLDLHYHYLSAGMMQKLQELGPAVDVSDQQGLEDEYRYPAVTE